MTGQKQYFFIIQMPGISKSGAVNTISAKRHRSTFDSFTYCARNDLCPLLKFRTQ
jgi:hypothetical protein